MALYTCKKCGKKVPMQYEVCPYCQTPRSAVNEVEEPPADIGKMKTCKTCGKLIRPLAKLSRAIKIADTSNQSKAESKTLPAITITF